jgi:Flp pilus assembly protein TadD
MSGQRTSWQSLGASVLQGKTQFAWYGLTILLLGAPGCAGWKQYLPSPSINQKRVEREAEAVRSFEEHRDAAQLEAALDRWKQGDAVHSEAMVVVIVNRRPEFADARLRLAEMLFARGDAAAAEPHLRSVLELNPGNAQAHHALGLLLDATSRGDEAHQHLAKAAELEPDNEVYQLTFESLVK